MIHSFDPYLFKFDYCDVLLHFKIDVDAVGKETVHIYRILLFHRIRC